MTTIFFVISNDRHHLAMFAPIISELSEHDGFLPVVVSLCEMRGVATPAASIEKLGASSRRVFPLAMRRGAVARGVQASKSKPRRHGLLQRLFWSILLKPNLARLLARPPALVVLPNDAAFPYDRLAAMLASRSIPYLLVQEGIRFPLPGVPRDRAYGRGGAAAIAAWGESSASYFREIGVEANRIHLTGNPRFDQIASRERRIEAPAGGSAAARHLLLVTNPIDEQGFCTKQEKLELVRRFVDGIEELVDSAGVRLTVKLHGSESRRDYEKCLESSSVFARVTLTEGTALYPLLETADAVVIMASTVGLEAMLFDCPVGVLELPATGFVFDYVASHSAMGITWARPLAPQIRELLVYDPRGASSFIRKHLATSREATKNVVRLIFRLTRNTA